MTPSQKLHKQTLRQQREIVLAESRTTPPKTLARLALRRDFIVAYCVANNHSAPSEALSHLAKSHDGAIRSAVANNWSTPAETLLILITDSAPNIARDAEKTLNESAKKHTMSPLCP